MGEPLGDRQAEAGSTVLAGGRGVDLPEGWKRSCSLSAAMPIPGVFDLETHQQAVAVAGFEAGPQGDRPVGEFDGVAGEVEQALAQAGRDRRPTSRALRRNRVQPWLFRRSAST